MKMQVTMKDPDKLIDAIHEARYDIVNDLMTNLGLSEAGAEAEAERRLEKMKKFAFRSFKWGDYLSVELDDEAQTITVLVKETIK